MSKVVLAERLREVRSLIGFTRIESPGDYTEIGDFPREQRVPLSRLAPKWVPTSRPVGPELGPSPGRSSEPSPASRRGQWVLAALDARVLETFEALRDSLLRPFRPRVLAVFEAPQGCSLGWVPAALQAAGDGGSLTPQGCSLGWVPAALQAAGAGGLRGPQGCSLGWDPAALQAGGQESRVGRTTGGREAHRGHARQRHP